QLLRALDDLPRARGRGDCDSVVHAIASAYDAISAPRRDVVGAVPQPLEHVLRVLTMRRGMELHVPGLALKLRRNPQVLATALVDEQHFAVFRLREIEAAPQIVHRREAHVEL